MLLKSAIHNAGRWYCQEVVRREYANQNPKPNERAVEYAFVLRWLAELSPRMVLDVGAGETAFPAILNHCGYNVTAIDNIRDYWSNGMYNRHWHIVNDSILNPKIGGHYDAITCISVLEHIPEHHKAVANMLRLLSPGGHLLMTFPYCERTYVPDVYKLSEASYGKDSSYICQMYSRSELDDWGTVVDQEYWEVFEGDFWACGNRLARLRRVQRDGKHHLTCVVLIPRYPSNTRPPITC